MDQEEFKMIIENSWNSEEIRLINWKIALDETFSIDPKILFKLRVITAFDTFNKENWEYIDRIKLPFLVEGFAGSTLINSLEKIKVNKSQYPFYEVSNYFNSKGFKISVSNY